MFRDTLELSANYFANNAKVIHRLSSSGTCPEPLWGGHGPLRATENHPTHHSTAVVVQYLVMFQSLL
jgi:hypothetical protein